MDSGPGTTKPRYPPKDHPHSLGQVVRYDRWSLEGGRGRADLEHHLGAGQA